MSDRVEAQPSKDAQQIINQLNDLGKNRNPELGTQLPANLIHEIQDLKAHEAANMFQKDLTAINRGVNWEKLGLPSNFEIAGVNGDKLQTRNLQRELLPPGEVVHY